MPALGEKLQEVLKSSDNIADLSAVVIAELECGETKIVEVVEGLEGWLRAVETEKRREGSKLLAEVLVCLPPAFLSPPEVRLLTAFFCDRLGDHYSITPPTLLALSALSLMDNFPESGPLDVIRALQQNVTCQALTVSNRRTFYTIFNNIYAKRKKKVLSDFPSDFLFGLVSGMDSESDPRNLLYLFSFLPFILSDIPLRHLAEDTFSVLECYFPVDYNPVEEKDNITRENLARGLEACLSSSTELADFCIPMICEKLDSSLKVAQMDSLSLLISGLKTWGLEQVSPHMQMLWTAVRPILLPSSDSERSSLAERLLVSLLAAYSFAVLGDAETKAFTYLLDSIASSTHGFLSDPSLSLFSPILKLLSTVSQVSSVTASFIIPLVLPQMVALLSSPRSSNDKDIVLKSLQPLLESSIKYDCWQADGCKEHLSKVLPLFVSFLEDPLCRASAMDCLSTVVSILPSDYRKQLYEFINKTVAQETSTINREAYGKFVTLVSEHFPDEVENQLLRTFSIPGDDREGDNIERLVELVCWTMSARALTLPAANLLLRYITAPPTPIFKPRALSLLQSYSSKCSEEVLRRLGSECDYPLSLVRSYLDGGVPAQDGELSSAAQLITNIVRTLEPSEQGRVLQAGLELLHPKLSSDSCPCFELVLLEGLVAGLQPAVQAGISLDLCEVLVGFSISLDLEEDRNSAARIIALILNKSTNEEEIETVLRFGEKGCSQEPSTLACVRICAWITKALILRGHPSADHWLERLLAYTSDPVLGMEGAEGVRLVLENSSLLSTANYCTIGLLYKQRVFEKVKLLIPGDRKPSKAASLALAYILINSPPALVLGKLDKLSGTMVHCVEEGDPIVSTAILRILSSLLASSLMSIGPLAHTFIPRCLRLAVSSPYMAVRQEALECIYLFANYKPEDMMQYKKMVTMELGKCLDDRKRLVRQYAVKARTKWFLL